MSAPSRSRDLTELILGYGMVVGIIWTPEHLQRFLSPVALVFTLSVVLARRQSRDELGLGRRGLIPSLWILPAAIALAALSTSVAARVGTLHP
ncbi:MAG: CPBP family intramembrane glutamate endopeptidase, partial [Candidatus Sulfotelmatobacter sp.]